MADEVRYESRGAIALITLNRPRYRNAQNSAMTYALDAAFGRAVNDDTVRVIVLAGAGDHFSAGHDIGTPERDADESFPRQAVLWWDHVGKAGADARYAREMVAAMPPFGLALAKRAVNQCEDQMGLRPGMDAVFGLHHVAHAHNAEVGGDSLAGLDARGMTRKAAQ